MIEEVDKAGDSPGSPISPVEIGWVGDYSSLLFLPDDESANIGIRF